MNRLDLIGRLVRDPELRYTQAGQAICNFTIAIDRKLSREKKEEMEAQNRPTADFIRINAWGKQGENASQYLAKGSLCAIEGRLQSGSYVDRETGKTQYTLDVVADNVQFLSKSSQNTTQNGQNYNSNTNTRRGQQNQPRGNYGANRNDDFFEDDFTEISDGGQIPF